MIESYNNSDRKPCLYIFMSESYIVEGMNNEHYLGNLIGAFATNIANRIEEQVATLGGRSLNHESALVAIHYHPNDTIDTLSKVLGLSHSGAVRLVDTLTKENLVVRHKSTADARSVVLCVSQKGKLRVEKILQARQKVTAQILSQYNEEEKQAIAQLLEPAMSKLAKEPIAARRVCRLCNEDVCRSMGCPVEKSVHVSSM